DVFYRADVLCPVGIDGVDIGRVHRDHPGAGGDPAEIIVSLGQDYDHLPDIGGDHSPAGIDRCRRPLGAGAAGTIAAHNDVDLVTGLHQRAAIVFQVGPGMLVVVRRLWDHIVHQKSRFIGDHRIGPVPRWTV